jgi:anaerobic ribonucleoside-triphosphate reductase activating protein
MFADPLLNLAAWAERSTVNGPGERFVLWVQGCPLRCPGCINPDFLTFISKQEIPVSRAATRILSTPGIEGVTYSGGEPTSQAVALAALGRLLKREGLTVVSYSGFTLAELRARGDPAIEAFLVELDILIDGPYLAAQAAALPWRGSANQQVHFLSPAYAHLAAAVQRPERQIELIAGENQWLMTGTWEAELRRRLETALAGKGKGK